MSAQTDDKLQAIEAIEERAWKRGRESRDAEVSSLTAELEAVREQSFVNGRASRLPEVKRLTAELGAVRAELGRVWADAINELRVKAVEFAKREWRANGSHAQVRSDAVQDFVDSVAELACRKGSGRSPEEKRWRRMTETCPNCKAPRGVLCRKDCDGLVASESAPPKGEE